jgi:hypothetical protein
MHVVRRRDADRIDLVVHLHEHFPKVRVAFRVRKLLHELLHVRQRRLLGLAILALSGATGVGTLQALPVDVAQGHDLLVLVRHDIAEPLAAAANLGDSDLGARGDRPGLPGVLRKRGATGEAEHRGGGRGEGEKIAAGQV